VAVIAIVALFSQRQVGVAIAAGRTGFDDCTSLDDRAGLGIASIRDLSVRIVSRASHRSRLIRRRARSIQ
jgi:hypothetical protein